MSFSGDNQLLLSLSGAPDYVLLCWDWVKAKVIAHAAVGTSSNLPFYRCSFNPIDTSVAW
jgi:hypothetical protein